MKSFAAIIFGLVLSLGAFAQPEGGTAPHESVDRDKHRRSELRSALNQSREQRELRQNHKQLSPQERQELRQQLHQQHRPIQRNNQEIRP